MMNEGGQGFSPADFAAMTGGGGLLGGGGGGIGAILVLFLLLLFVRGGNWGGNGGGDNSGAAYGYVLTSDFAAIERKLDSITNGLCDGFYREAQLINGVQAATAQGFYNAEISRANQQMGLMQQLNNMQAHASDCCCQTQRAIDGIGTILCGNTRDIIENQNNNARAILDALTAQRIEAKNEQIAAQNQEIFGLKLAASQAAQNNYLIGQLRPCPSPAYVVPNPYCCQPCGC